MQSSGITIKIFLSKSSYQHWISNLMRSIINILARAYLCTLRTYIPAKKCGVSLYDVLVVTRENIIKFKNIDFMGFYVFEIDNF